MPAVGELVVRVEEVQTIAALLVAVGDPLEPGALGHVAQLEGLLLVDLFRLRSGEHIFGVRHRAGTVTQGRELIHNSTAASPSSSTSLVKK